MALEDEFLLEAEDFKKALKGVTPDQVAATLKKRFLNGEDFIVLLSPAAREKSALEAIAQRANGQSLRQFGRTVSLYTPLYLANHCDNLCVYCGFHQGANIHREQLSLDEARRELEAIYATGIRDVLLLTGESARHTKVDYIAAVVRIAKEELKFKSVGIEVYPMEEADYRILVEAGVNSLTLYQETYDKSLYKEVHLRGPKANYHNRLEAPERAARAGMHQISIGALYGLGDPRLEAYRCHLHMRSLEKKYPHVEWGLSLPRLREATSWAPKNQQPLSDLDYVQLFLAFRVCFERLSIAVSTRETHDFRKHLIPLGVNKLSAGVLTTVGGYAQMRVPVDHMDQMDVEHEKTAQFPIADGGSVYDVVRMVRDLGYQEIYSDWVNLRGGLGGADSEGNEG